MIFDSILGAPLVGSYVNAMYVLLVMTHVYHIL